jgi:hypothetical protein
MILVPVAFVLGVRKQIPAAALEHVIAEVALIGAAICPLEVAKALLMAILVLTLVDGPVGVSLLALAVEEVIVPVPGVHGAILGVVLALAVGFVALEVSLVCVACGVDEPAIALMSVVIPLAFVEALVGKQLLSPAHPLVRFGVALVDGAIGELQDTMLKLRVLGWLRLLHGPQPLKCVKHVVVGDVWDCVAAYVQASSSVGTSNRTLCTSTSFSFWISFLAWAQQFPPITF